MLPLLWSWIEMLIFLPLYDHELLYVGLSPKIPVKNFDTAVWVDVGCLQSGEGDDELPTVTPDALQAVEMADSSLLIAAARSWQTLPGSAALRCEEEVWGRAQ